MRYTITRPLTLQGLANEKYRDLTFSEVNKRGFRIIGGDKGDLMFDGYTLDHEASTTTLYKPVLQSGLALSDDEAFEVAQEVLLEAFDAVGLEAVEHS